MVAIAFGTRAGIVACILDVILLVTVGYFIWTERIIFPFNINTYATALNSWLVMGIIFFMFVPVLILSMGIIHKSLTSSLTELQESHAKNRRMVDNLVDSFLYRHNTKGIFTYVSSSITKVLGYSAEEFLTHISEYLTDHPVNQKVSIYTEQSILGIQQPSYEIEIIHKDNSIRWLEVSEIPVFDTTGNVVAVEGLAHDITKRKKYEEELKSLQIYLSDIIDSMPSMLIGVDSDGQITQWNKEAENITGIKTVAALNKYIPDLIPRLEPDMPLVKKAIKTKVVQSASRHNVDDKGIKVSEDVTVYPVKYAKKEGAVIRIDNVTEKVRLKEIMVQSEKMLSVGGLAAGMAHEINNPLAGMLQTASVMSNRLMNKIDNPVSQKAAEEAGTDTKAIKTFMEKRDIPKMINSIKESGERVLEIIRNMLSFSRKSEAVFSSHNLCELLDKTLGLASTEFDLKKKFDFKQISITKEYEDNLPLVVCESSKIQQVFLNLLRNGSQAMQEAGIVNPGFTLRIYRDKERKYISIEIEDNGPGMTDDIRKRIFEPFFTTKPEGIGTGLGLSVSYFIITDNHKGEMVVESTPGIGTKFIIRLPV